MRAHLKTLCLVFFVCACAVLASGQTKRVVVLQCDGLPNDVVDRAVNLRDPRTGKSELPWFDYVFYQHGTRLANFYVRGMSLSAPSWSLINTGQHLQIKGNVEFDRYTLQTYDYLNFVPFYVNATVGRRVDMQGAEVLDAVGVPLLTDAFARNERHVNFSLYQRGVRFITFQKALENRFRKEPKEVFDEWTMQGLGLRDSVPEQVLRELIAGINDPNLHYLEFLDPGFDHAAHHNNDWESQLAALKQLDAAVGQIWTAIQKSSVVTNTVFIVVSDHGFNTDPRIYSQGFNLVKLFGSPAGGGHHVVTKRRLLLDYAIKGINPFVPTITTTTRDSYYLKSQSNDYPTALLDFDGNERASVHFRDSDLNLLQIIFQQLQRNDISPALRKALTDQWFKTIDSRRSEWQQTLDGINEELVALRKRIASQKELCAEQPKKFTKEQLAAGDDEQARRVCAWYDIWNGQDQNYSEYARTLSNLLSLRRENFVPQKLTIEDLIARKAMGEHNSVYELQNYVIGIAPSGLALQADGSLDLQKSFLRINYFSLLKDAAVRNNVQPGVSNHPIDLVAMRLSADQVQSQLNESAIEPDVVWVNDGDTDQALILARRDSQDNLSFRYVPIDNLTEDSNGQVRFKVVPWRNSLPLHIFEDPQLHLPAGDRAEWLNEWHTDIEWLHALHNTQYSNGLIGLHEELARHRVGKLSLDESGLSDDERLQRRLLRRQRENIEADLLIVANDHWNFDVRGFNPGGNHGSFFRISTHSTFMIAGGDNTGIPRGLVVDEPYDSLSVVPTILALTGKLRDDNQPIPVLWQKGFRHFPGRVVKELFNPPEIRKIAVTGATGSH